MLIRRPLFLLLIAACTASPTSTADVPNAITLKLPVAEIKVGDEIQLTADVRNGADAPLLSAALEWSTDNPTIATVSAAGRLRGIAAGTVHVTVRAGAVSEGRSVTVRPVEPFSITILPLATTLRMGEQVKVVADVRALGGYQLINASVSWSVDHPGVASVSVFGDLVALSPGVVTVTAVSNAARATQVVTILPGIPAQIEITGRVFRLDVDGTTQYAAVVRTASGIVLPEWPVTWSSTAPGVATVSSTGEVTAIGVGLVSIRASAGALSSSVLLSVIAQGMPLHQLAFLRTNILGDAQIEVIAEDGVKLMEFLPSVALTTPTLAGGPTATLTPDGASIVFDCVGGICWLDLPTGTTVLDYSDGVSEPTWDRNRDGLLLRGGYSSVVRFSPYDHSVITLPTGFYVERPRISPDGQTVLYECDYYHNYEPLDNLCRMDAAGNVTLYKSIANAVSWSPFGTLAYVRSLDWTQVARMLVIEPLQAQPNPDGPGATEYPGFDDVTETVWSPDGQRLALVRNGELWIYSMPGLTNPVRIAQVPGTRISSVSWR